MAALAQELGLTLIPMDECKISDIDGRPVALPMDQRIQALWNKVLDECAEKQQQSLAAAAASVDDSRGETSEESNGEGSVNGSAGSEAAENGSNTRESREHASSADGTSEATRTDSGGDKEDAGGGKQIASNGGPKLKRRARRSSASLRTPVVSLGKLLEETASAHVANFSKAEHELWGWHRGNLEISCGAVSGLCARSC